MKILFALYSEGDTIGQLEADCLNALKHQQAMNSAFEKGITELTHDEYILRYIREAELLVPTLPVKRDKTQTKARQLCIAAIKDKYKARGLLVKGNLPQIEALADKIEASPAFDSFMHMAEIELKAKESK